MKPRKLCPEEHIRTRKLWEQIFTEDTTEFLDYYYNVKIKDNEIYVIEDDGEIVSMLHLNPYDMRIGEEIYCAHYIVAVATDPRYRRRGLMAMLLHYAMEVMNDRGEPFTFLMPASEAIYRPFGFEFIYDQGRSKIKGKNRPSEDAIIAEATEHDCQEMADFANEFLKEYDVVAHRTETYYKTVLAEQKSENGGILIQRRQGRLDGVCCYAKEQEYEIREPLFSVKEDLQHAIYYLTGNEAEEVLCVGYGEEDMKPMIMAKVLKPDLADNLKNKKVFLNEVV